MTSKKEDEKNERIIRGLLKLPANRRCINCNNLGPQYVCTNFWMFICTNCSGIHREFTHRVKSISMAKFTTQEVIALQEGGNERAKEFYFKEWDPQRQSVPDSSNIDRLRDFIKHVYVDRRYTGERNADRPPRANLGDREDSSENRKVESSQGDSRSPPFDDRRAGYGGRNVPRSPGYDGGDYKTSPSRFEGDRFGNGNQNRRFEERGFPDGVPKPEGKSPNHQKKFDASSPPVVRPVRDILGDDTPTLRVGEPPKSNGTRILDSPAQTRRTSSSRSSSMGSSEGSFVQQKAPSSGSLIDFDADPEPTVPAAVQSVSQQTTSVPTDGGNWASFDFTSQQIAPQTASNATTLDSMLGQLSAPTSAPSGNMSTSPHSGIDSYPTFNNGVSTMQQQQPPFPASSIQFANPQPNAPTVGAVNQPWGSLQTANLQAGLTAPTGYPPQGASRPPQAMGASVPSQPPAEVKPSGRTALPEDLFASLYAQPTSVPGWRGHPQYPGMGYGPYGMQYPTGATMATAQPPSQPSNPFDFMNGPSTNQASMFPSMASLQGALPNVAHPSALLPTSHSASSQWIPPQQMSYPPMSQSPYMMPQQVMSNMPQQVPNNTIPIIHQGIQGPGIEGAFYGTSGMDQHLTPQYSQPGTISSSGSVGGNPFG